MLQEFVGLGRRRSESQNHLLSGYWVSDQFGKNCYDCEKSFSLFNRRHHCRICGFIFCLSCIQPGEFFVPATEQTQIVGRVCRYCYNLRRPTAAETTAGQRRVTAPQLSVGADSGPASAERRSSESAPSQSLRRQPSLAISIPSLGGASARSQSGVQPAHEKGMPAERPLSAAHSDAGTSALPPLPNAAASTRRLQRQERTEGRPGPAASDPAWTWDPADPLQIPQALLEQTQAGGSEGQGQHAELHPMAAIYRLPLSVVADQHLASLAAQLLKAEHVEDVGAWCPVITFLALEAASAVSPTAMAAFGVRDPRFYIKVKKVPDGGTPEQSCFIQGLVCRKNLTHRRMRKHIPNPRILLLASRLESHRTQTRLASFDHYTNDQEAEHLRLAVARLTQLQPDVLLVEKSVARSAQEALLNSGVSLALNMKRSTLDRVARCTGAQVADSLDQVSQSCIGHCQEFAVEDILPNTPALERTSMTAGKSEAAQENSAGERGPAGRALMYVKGCPHALGCTMLLKGGPITQLRRVKKVARFVAFAAYRCRLETAFLADQLASATFAAAEAESLASHPPNNSHQHPNTALTTSSSSSLPSGLNSLAATADGVPVPLRPDSAISPDFTRPLSMRSATRMGHARQVTALDGDSNHHGSSHKHSQSEAPHHGPSPSDAGESPGARLQSAASAPGMYLLGDGTDAAPKLDISAFTRSQLQTQAEQTVQLSADAAAADRHRNIIASISPHVSLQDEGDHVPQLPSPTTTATQGPSSKPSPRSPDSPPPTSTTPSSRHITRLWNRDQPSPDQAASSAQHPDPDHSAPQMTNHDASSTPATGTLRTALGVFERLAAERDHAKASDDKANEPQPTPSDPLSIAARELISKDHLVSQSSAVFGAVLDELCDEQVDLQGGQVVDMQHLHLSTASRNLLRGAICEPAHTERFDFYTGSDVSLAAFLGSMLPFVNRCQSTTCNDGPGAHLLSFLHGSGLMSFSVTRLGLAKALPGSEHGQIWFWARPQEAGQTAMATAGRVALSPEASCLSLAHFFELSFGACYLQLSNRAMHSGFARYFGLGQLVACFLFERVECYDVTLPPAEIACQVPLEQEWLTGEIDSLIEEANAAFRAINAALALAESRIQAAKAAKGNSADPAGADASADGSSAAVGLLQDALAAEGQGLSDMVQDVCSMVLPGKASAEAPDSSPAPDSEKLVAALWQINRLRRSLAVLSMTWYSRLQEPNLLASAPAPSTGLSAGMAGSAAASPSQPMPRSQSGSVPADVQRSRSERPADTAYRLHRPRSLLGLDQHGDVKAAAGDGNSTAVSALKAVASDSELARGSKDISIQENKPMSPRALQSIPRGMVAQRRALWEQPVIKPPSWAPLQRTATASDSVLQWLNANRQGGGSSAADPPMLLGGTSQSEAATGQGSDTDEGTDVEDTMSESGRSDRSQGDWQQSAHRRMSRLSRQELTSTEPMPPLKEDTATTEKENDTSVGAKTEDVEIQSSIEGTTGPGAVDADLLNSGAMRKALQREESQLASHFDTDYWGQMLESMRAQEQEVQGGLGAAGAMAASASRDALSPNGEASDRPRLYPDPSAIASSAERSASPLISPSGLPMLMKKTNSSELIMGTSLPHIGSAVTTPVSAAQMKPSGRALLPPGVGDRVVVVRDDEPTSIIAYSLSSREYHTFLDKALANLMYGSAAASAQELNRAHRQAGSTAMSAEWDPSSLETLQAGDGRHHHSDSTASDAGLPAGSPRQPGMISAHLRGRSAVSRPESGSEWKVLLSREPMHFEHSVVDDGAGQPSGKARMQVTAWYAPQFAELRRRVCVGGEEAYLASLSRCRPWEARGGKTRAYFAKTNDDRYIVKQLQPSEKRSFPEIAPSYFRYLAHSLRKNLPTCLAKIMGIYTVMLRTAGGREAPMDLLVMENIFYAGNLAPIYDLKGSERARLARDDPSDPTRVLLDQNLVQHNLGSPILVGSEAHARLLRALWSDTAFLAGLGVMDYSLLVGMNQSGGTLVVGIIDFIRQYTWDKALERPWTPMMVSERWRWHMQTRIRV
ncbi:hypothetical protein WJX73_010097 [Symbiochloris irregularis]|uniref:1-phosphatidylinositol-3-phosphate 5-kinase n=1 Tax=Symbiochloris irregularis TaxID=706552 RepID=A0AAW1NTN6_9CHLO